MRQSGIENMTVSHFRCVSGKEGSRRYGPRREKTCLRGFRKSDIQMSLLSYRDKLEH